MHRESPTDATVTTHPSIMTNVTVVPEVFAANLTGYNVRKDALYSSRQFDCFLPRKVKYTREIKIRSQARRQKKNIARAKGNMYSSIGSKYKSETQEQ